MDGISSVGQDLYEALVEACKRDEEHAAQACDAIYPADPTNRWTWGTLPAHVKAIFQGAALRFLSE